jgi:glucose-6-phosphate 1-dehydrogenase
MSETHSDALVFFGATGDLAYKKIFPSLQAMLKRGHLNVPVIGVALLTRRYGSAAEDETTMRWTSRW